MGEIVHDCCVYPSNFAIDTFLYNHVARGNQWNGVVYILQILQLIHSYTTALGRVSWWACCVYPSNFAIDTFLYNGILVSRPELFVVYILQILQLIHSYTTNEFNAFRRSVVYILQILQLIHSYTTRELNGDPAKQLCISFKFCN